MEDLSGGAATDRVRFALLSGESVLCAMSKYLDRYPSDVMDPIYLSFGLTYANPHPQVYSSCDACTQSTSRAEREDASAPGNEFEVVTGRPRTDVQDVHVRWRVGKEVCRLP